MYLRQYYSRILMLKCNSFNMSYKSKVLAIFIFTLELNLPRPHYHTWQHRETSAASSVEVGLCETLFCSKNGNSDPSVVRVNASEFFKVLFNFFGLLNVLI